MAKPLIALELVGVEQRAARALLPSAAVEDKTEHPHVMGAAATTEFLPLQTPRLMVFKLLGTAGNGVKAIACFAARRSNAT